MSPKLDETSETTRLLIKVPEALIARIETWASRQPGFVNRSEAVRRLLELALTAEGVSARAKRKTRT
ncbi:MAG: hypothetical protein ABW003_02210 [Microvirga sp.]